ncbi:unnamed protein product [Kuraishia capsulata CBS 1993]|uniref:Transcription initiation factor TFIID subunit 9 n=1 Tax=Kuraishia capsulata CBS 1993 TaxID=1382522 RepID=W6ML74_9ASCO|nr:uncharacterized protein KUCA_T00001487001 [Kuraishia capsulata CBS 1993]CDK25517.1 unnamed protein product [Kuraishia capsulata CBS 1993]
MSSKIGDSAKQNGDASSEQKAVPRDVRLLHLIFATQGYTTGVLQDATLYNDHAHGAGAHVSNAGNAGTNSPLTNEDIRLAIASRTNYQFKPVPPKELLLELAAEKNRKPLPPVMPSWGIRLPPEKFCLTAKDWSLSDEESEVS